MLSVYIDFANNYYIYLLVYIFIPILFFLKARIGNNLIGNSFLSKSCTDQLRGLCIVVVVIHHISERMDHPGIMVIFKAPLGYFVVGVFFFLSGLGLTKSLLKDPNYLDRFLIKKLVGVYVPFVIVNVFTLTYLIMKGDSFSGIQILEIILSIKLIDTSMWFLLAILIFYGLFWLSFVITNNEKSILLVTFLVCLYCLLSKLIGLGSWWYFSSLCFPMGIIYAFYSKGINVFILNNYVTIFALSIFLFLLTYFLLREFCFYNILFFSCCLFTVSVVLPFVMIDIRSPVFAEIGKISLEIYLIHMKVLVLFATFLRSDSSISIIVYFIALLLLAKLFNCFNKYLYNSIFSRIKIYT